METHKYFDKEQHSKMCEKYQRKIEGKHIPSLSFGLVCDDCLIGKLETKTGVYKQDCDLSKFG